MKIKVLIVDDEYLQRELVKNSINWGVLDMEVTGEAADGRQALAMAEKSPPDVIIMDINIPYYNGLEISRRIRKQYPETQILILTAYGEFDYARDAVQFGAVSYILKPLDPIELTQELTRCAKRLHEIWGREEGFKLLQMSKARMEKERFLLEQLTNPPCGGSGAPEQCRLYGLPVDSPLCVLNLHFPDITAYRRFGEELEEMIGEYFPQSQILHVGDDLLAILFCLLDPNEFNLQTQTFFERINQDFCAPQQVWGGASEIHTETGELYFAYREARAACSQASASGRLLNYESPQFLAFLQKGYYRPEVFLNHLRTKQYKEAFDLVNNCFKELKFAQLGFTVTANILINFSLYVMELGVDIQKQLEEEYKLLSRLSDSGELCQMEQELCRFIEVEIERIQNRLPPSTKRKVEDARGFIDKNFSRRDLSLDLVAEAVGLNPSYLSTIFKNECGCSLTRYIMNTRLENARQRMNEDPAVSVTALAEETGYTDAYYFSKSFKNQFGISPSKYLGNRNV